MKVAVPKETRAGENRVALTPDAVRKLSASDVAVSVQAGAGEPAGFSDDMYREAGAEVTANDSELLAGAGVVVKVQPVTAAEAALLPASTVLVSLFGGEGTEEALEVLAARQVTVLALEKVPRISRAQSMDVLSSQSTVAGYKAVLIGASELGKFLPMLTTAAGSIAPARVFVIGAGVAGLQAIATARRLGAVVSAFDIRPAAAEQVRSLGATFVATDLLDETAETKGGYAKEQAEDQQQRTLDAIGKHIIDQDLVITTAQIPGRPAPRLITGEMVRAMRPGSVIVDLAAESGGNCELTRAGETVRDNGVAIIGPANLPSTLPTHASQMFSKNVLTLLQHLIPDGELALDPEDEITKAMTITPGDGIGAARR